MQIRVQNKRKSVRKSRYDGDVSAGWKKLHEKSRSSLKMLHALVMEQKEELAKVRIEHLAAVKVRNAVVEEMMKARVKKSWVMDRMKKMAEEMCKEVEVVEAMKKQLRLRGQQPFM